MECPKCRHEIQGLATLTDLIYCPYCGKNIKADIKGLCITCGQTLPAKAVFCPRCGKKSIANELPLISSEVPERHLSSREDIAEVGNIEVNEPIAQAVADSKSENKPSGESLWHKFMMQVKKAIGPLNEFLAGQWRVRQLYRKWARDGVISKNEIPTPARLTTINKEAGEQVVQPFRLWWILTAAFVLIAFFIIMGITMSQCQ